MPDEEIEEDAYCPIHEEYHGICTPQWCPAHEGEVYGDVTVEDHGVCYDCHRDIIHGLLCAVCFGGHPTETPEHGLPEPERQRHRSALAALETRPRLSYRRPQVRSYRRLHRRPYRW